MADAFSEWLDLSKRLRGLKDSIETKAFVLKEMQNNMNTQQLLSIISHGFLKIIHQQSTFPCISVFNQLTKH